MMESRFDPKWIFLICLPMCPLCSAFSSVTVGRHYLKSNLLNVLASLITILPPTFYYITHCPTCLFVAFTNSELTLCVCLLVHFSVFLCLDVSSKEAGPCLSSLSPSSQRLRQPSQKTLAEGMTDFEAHPLNDCTKLISLGRSSY